MRSFFLENLTDYSDSFSLDARQMHHLVKVIRIRPNEITKAFDFKNNVFTLKVIEIDKKLIHFEVLERSVAKMSSNSLSLGLGKLKKESLDLSIKQAVEMGINDIFIFDSEFSQKYSLKKERINKLIISAMEQSNNFYFPNVIEVTLEKLLEVDKPLIYFSSIEKDKKHQKIDTLVNDSLIIIGPEGGLSAEEENKISKIAKYCINLEVPIMRASTAVGFCVGYCFSKMDQN